MPVRVALSALAVFLLVAAGARGAVPDWVTRAAQVETPPHARDAPAVVLLRENEVELVRPESVERRERIVIRVLRPEGRHAAARSHVYQLDSLTSRWLRAWHLPPDGEPEHFEANDMPDVLADPNDVYSDVRIMRADASHVAEVGSVFAAEWYHAERPLYGYLEWRPGGLPVVEARLDLTLPAGWSAVSRTFEHARIEPRRDGRTSTWTLRSLPWVASRALAPSRLSRSPWIAVRFFESPRDGRPAVQPGWADVGAWLEGLARPAIQPTDDLLRHAFTVTDGVGDELGRLDRIAREAQSTKYVSIQTGVGRGGGYRPRTATEVLRTRHGDCKDQAALLRCLADALGLQAHGLALFSGDPDRVREEWPSPQQFNHAIAAIAVPEDHESPGTITHPALGRLLVLNPTAWSVPPGELPLAVQGGLALVTGDPTGTLVRLPVAPPEVNHVERTVEARLAADGALVATLRERSTGAEASDRRRLRRWLTGSESRRLARELFAGGPAGVEVTRLEETDADGGRAFDVELELRVPQHGRPVGDRLVVMRPVLRDAAPAPDLECPQRSEPIRLTARSLAETTTIALPSGLEAEALPAPLSLHADFGRLEASCAHAEGELRCRREAVHEPVTLPAARCAEVQAFLEAEAAAARRPVVLARR